MPKLVPGSTFTYPPFLTLFPVSLSGLSFLSLYFQCFAVKYLKLLCTFPIVNQLLYILLLLLNRYHAIPEKPQTLIVIVITYSKFRRSSRVISFLKLKSEPATDEMVPESTVAGPSATDVGDVGK